MAKSHAVLFFDEFGFEKYSFVDSKKCTKFKKLLVLPSLCLLYTSRCKLLRSFTRHFWRSMLLKIEGGKKQHASYEDAWEKKEERK